jgi:hypothetical protein
MEGKSTDGMLERKEKEQKKEREREILPEERVCQWRSGKIESKRKMDECRAEWKGQRHRQAKKKGKNQRIQIQERVYEREYDRGNSGVHGEKEKWWRYLDVWTRREKTGIGWKERKEGAECAMKRDTIEHVWNGCSEKRSEEKSWMKTEGR